MEAKKNPAYDLSRQRNKFFLIGLSISIGLAISAFEWTTVKVQPKSKEYNEVITEPIFYIPEVKTESPVIPVQAEIKQPIQKQTDPVLAVTIIETSNQTTPDQVVPTIDYTENTTNSLPIITDVETGEDIVVFAEHQPEPINGYKAFYEQLGKMIKYPRQAKSIGTEGKVFVEFIINKNGEPSDLKILKGIGSGCDEEAMRILALTKWEPGKQRGKPVRVKMVLPVYFKLSN
ncbi:MAG: energy transducer TonB [Bacteroidetes bacterium]|nr:energy transducer TonB [Bacteroidota bacterium]